MAVTGFETVKSSMLETLWNSFLISCSDVITCRNVKSKKGKFLYSAVSSPQDHSKRFTLYFPDRPVHSDTISASLGSIQPYATINA